MHFLNLNSKYIIFVQEVPSKTDPFWVIWYRQKKSLDYICDQMQLSAGLTFLDLQRTKV